MRKNTALYLLAFIICALLAGFIFNIQVIKSIFYSTTAMMSSPYVIVPAAICAFIFINNKNYWLINSGCAVAASLIIQYGVIGHGAGIYTILYRALAFILIVYLLNLVKVIFNK